MFDDDLVSHECQVLDVSLNGAKLVAVIDIAIGSTFSRCAMASADVASLYSGTSEDPV